MARTFVERRRNHWEMILLFHLVVLHRRRKGEVYSEVSDLLQPSLK